MVDMVDQLNIIKQRLDAILKRFSFLKNCPVSLPLPTVPQSIENQKRQNTLIACKSEKDRQ